MQNLNYIKRTILQITHTHTREHKHTHTHILPNNATGMLMEFEPTVLVKSKKHLNGDWAK